VFAFMLVEPGKTVLRGAISKIHPAKRNRRAMKQRWPHRWAQVQQPAANAIPHRSGRQYRPSFNNRHLRALSDKRSHHRNQTEARVAAKLYSMPAAPFRGSVRIVGYRLMLLAIRRLMWVKANTRNRIGPLPDADRSRASHRNGPSRL